MPLEASAVKRRILRNVARIASRAFQEKCCVQATPDEYVLLDELIETTLSQVEHEVANKTLARKWSATELDILRSFSEHVNRLFDRVPWRDASVDLPKIVYEDRSMCAIRDAATNCLSTLGVSFSLEELLAE